MEILSNKSESIEYCKFKKEIDLIFNKYLFTIILNYKVNIFLLNNSYFILFLL